MDLLTQEKIKRFLSDKLMSDSVREVLTKSFLKTCETKDVQYLAASMIAVDKLDKGFKDLEKFARPDDKQDKELKQIGL